MKRSKQEKAIQQAKADAVKVLTEAVERAVILLQGGAVHKPIAHTAISEGWMTKDQVRDYLQLPSVQSVERLMYRGKLKYSKPRFKTTLIRRSDVDAMMERFAHKPLLPKN